LTIVFAPALPSSFSCFHLAIASASICRSFIAPHRGSTCTRQVIE